MAIEKWVPEKVMIPDYGYEWVKQIRTWPPYMHPHNCPLTQDCTAVEVETLHGRRWYGVEEAWIDSHLRMRVSGFPAGFEELQHWPDPEDE